MKTLIAANWKMHGDFAWASKPAEFLTHMNTISQGIEVLICPPAYMIPRMVRACDGTGIQIGAQNCHQVQSGAFTGEMSADMVKDSGASYVILGHSERRSLFGETSAIVASKAAAAFDAGLSPIICVGESKEQRTAGHAYEIVGEQLHSSIPKNAKATTIAIAYEPVWAIGTGLVPTIEDIASMHDHIRGILVKRFGGKLAQSIRILYGGSVKPSNAQEILALSEVNGALIGGASLEMHSFAAIAKAAL